MAYSNLLGGTATTVHVDHPPLEDGLLTLVAKDHADLLVMGLRPRSQSRRVFARRMAMKAPCSVLTVPVGWPARVGPVLVAVDFSEQSADTLLTGIALARLAGSAQVTVFHAYFDDTAVGYEGHAKVLRQQQELEMLRFLRPLEAGGVTLAPVIEETPDVVAAIRDAADSIDAGLIVMGTRGRSRSAAVLLGSETEHALQMTTRPLLAVKHHGASLGLRQALLDAKIWHRDTSRFG